MNRAEVGSFKAVNSDFIQWDTYTSENKSVSSSEIYGDSDSTRVGIFKTYVQYIFK